MSYPVHASRVVQWVWCALIGGAALVLMLWWWHGAGLGVARWLRIGISAALFLGCAVVGWQALQRMPKGHLRWDGQRWLWQHGDGEIVMQGAPVVVLDLQSLLVMALCMQRGRRQMVVLQRHWAPAAWGDLRRAVYSVAHPTPDAADNQMP